MRPLKHFLCACFAFSFLSLSPLLTHADEPVDQFAVSEHLAIGDQIKLRFNNDDQGIAAHPLHLPNGLDLTYGEIVSLGDMYGTVGKPISQGADNADRRARFLAAFNSFAITNDATDEVKQILAIVHHELDIVTEGLNDGRNPNDIFTQLGDSTSQNLNCVTGGSCLARVWWLYPGRYLNLAEENFDHFGNNAWLAYQAGHEIAINEASIAGKTNDITHLQLAYAMNAFACHFLSDRFSSGHIRTPRYELQNATSPAIIGAVLANFMHNEESDYGIPVTNNQGDTWIAYGDHSFFDLANDTNRIKVIQALQLSADEVFQSFLQNTVGTPDDKVAQLVPYAINAFDSHQHGISPLFYWDNNTQTLMRRADVNNVYDVHFTADWWALPTLIELAKKRGLPSYAQSRLARSRDANQLLKAGLITNPNIIYYLNEHHVQ